MFTSATGFAWQWMCINHGNSCTLAKLPKTWLGFGPLYLVGAASANKMERTVFVNLHAFGTAYIWMSKTSWPEECTKSTRSKPSVTQSQYSM